MRAKACNENRTESIPPVFPLRKLTQKRETIHISDIYKTFYAYRKVKISKCNVYRHFYRVFFFLPVISIQLLQDNSNKKEKEWERRKKQQNSQLDQVIELLLFWVCVRVWAAWENQSPQREWVSSADDTPIERSENCREIWTERFKLNGEKKRWKKGAGERKKCNYYRNLVLLFPARFMY